ncbi:unnamed protein product [Lampetra planeri]
MTSPAVRIARGGVSACRHRQPMAARACGTTSAATDRAQGRPPGPVISSRGDGIDASPSVLLIKEAYDRRRDGAMELRAAA